MKNLTLLEHNAFELDSIYVYKVISFFLVISGYY